MRLHSSLTSNQFPNTYDELITEITRRARAVVSVVVPEVILIMPWIPCCSRKRFVFKARRRASVRSEDLAPLARITPTIVVTLYAFVGNREANSRRVCFPCLDNFGD